MSTCANCGESLSDNQSVHRLGLEIEDRTRSTKQFMGDEANIKRIYFYRDLCEQCWNDWHDRLVPDDQNTC